MSVWWCRGQSRRRRKLKKNHLHSIVKNLPRSERLWIHMLFVGISYGSCPVNRWQFFLPSVMSLLLICKCRCILHWSCLRRTLIGMCYNVVINLRCLCWNVQQCWNKLGHLCFLWHSRTSKGISFYGISEKREKRKRKGKKKNINVY